MTQRRLGLFGVLFSLLAAGVIGTLDAADPAVLTAFFGEGVKAFNAGRYDEADAALTTTIEAGSRDPRCYYFRGLSRSRLGRASDAERDFTDGAALEATDFDLFFNVSRALERVQGSERLTLETYRAAGRNNALKEIEKIRFEHFRRFLGEQTGEAAAAPAEKKSSDGAAPAAAPQAPEKPADNPFGSAAAPETPNTPTPTQPTAETPAAPAPSP